jgi:ferredoxin
MKKITQNHKDCIGCGTCIVLCPKYFDWDEENKAKLVGGKKNEKDEYELEVEELGTAQDAADACPVQVISIK